MAIRAVVVDLGGVLFNIPDITRRYTKWESHLRLRTGELHLILRQEGFFADADVGRFSEQGMVARLAAILGLREEQALEFLADLEAQKELNQELVAFLKSLRPHYKTAALSNAWPGARKVYACHRLEEIMDIVVYSCEERIAKPEPGIFRLVCERLGVLPEETVFLDDTEGHVVGARSSGMKAILFKNTTQAIAEIQSCLDADRDSG